MLFKSNKDVDLEIGFGHLGYVDICENMKFTLNSYHGPADEC